MHDMGLEPVQRENALSQGRPLCTSTISRLPLAQVPQVVWVAPPPGTRAQWRWHVRVHGSRPSPRAAGGPCSTSRRSAACEEGPRGVSVRRGRAVRASHPDNKGTLTSYTAHSCTYCHLGRKDGERQVSGVGGQAGNKDQRKPGQLDPTEPAATWETGRSFQLLDSAWPFLE